MVKSKEKASLKATTKQLKDIIFKTLDDNKAEDIEIISLKDKTDIADWMIIASGRSDRHVKSLALHVARSVKNSRRKHQIEGLDQKDWVLVDCYDIIVHIFQKEARNYYKIEDLWSKKAE